MAYNLKYQTGWSSPQGVNGVLYIDEKDYAGTVTDLYLQGEVVKIENVFSDWDTNVIGRRCAFTILNNRTDYFELFGLLTATERQFRVRVEATSPSSVQLFEGFLDLKTISHGYLNFQPIYLVANSYLSKLENIYPTSIDTLSKITFIDIIDEILRSVGTNFNIRVNCRLYAEGDTLPSNKTLFNLNGFFSEVFWENNIDRIYSNEILLSILTSFNCYLYWWDGYWYIEHYSDIWNTSISFVEYTSGVSYSPSDTGSVVVVQRTLQDVHDLLFIRTSQEVKVTPGYRLIQVYLNGGDTLLINLLSDLERNNLPTVIPMPIPIVYPKPDTRDWLYLSRNDIPIGWILSGEPHGVIVASVMRGHEYDTRLMGVLLATTFETTVLPPDTNGIGGTEITLTFKYADGLGEFKDVEEKNYNDYYMVFEIILYFDDNGTTKYIIFKDDRWYITSSRSLGEDNGPSAIVEYANFDTAHGSCEVSMTIPLGRVHESDVLDDYYLVDNNIEVYHITLGGEKLWKRSQSDRNLSRLCFFGDFKISVSNDIDFNLIEGSINTDFLNKKEINIVLADNANLNYTNGILRGDLLDIRTSLWTRDGITKYPLVDWLLLEKFRIYNLTRQTISSEVNASILLPPFWLYTESKQNNKKFVLTFTSHSPHADEYLAQLDEYDNETEVTIVNE